MKKNKTQDKLQESKEWAINLLKNKKCMGFTLITVTDRGYICSGFTVTNDVEIGAIKLGLERLLNHIDKWNLNPELLLSGNRLEIKEKNKTLNYMG